MRPILFGLLLIGCQSGQQYRAVSKPVAVLGGVHTGLRAPQSCPRFAPGHSDDDDELQWVIGCGIDDTGAAYGLSTGDVGPDHPGLAVLPGQREVGIFFFLPDGWTANDVNDSKVHAWAAPTNVHSLWDCCAEDHADGRLPLKIVAAGEGGFIVSLGEFDDRPLQVAIDMDLANAANGQEPFTIGYTYRFYVNGEPN